MSTNGFERDALNAKYGIDRPTEADNSTVTAILAAERTVARAVRLAGDTGLRLARMAVTSGSLQVAVARERCSCRYSVGRSS